MQRATIIIRSPQFVLSHRFPKLGGFHRVPSEGDVRYWPHPFNSGCAGFVPSLMGQRSDGSIAVAIFADQQRFVVVADDPKQRFEGEVDQDNPALNAIGCKADFTG